MERLPGRCPHCGGTFMVEKGVNKCVTCSRETEGTRGLFHYYEFNKDAIMADAKELGQTKTRTKWKIPQGSFHRLSKRWSKNGAKPPVPAPASVSNVALPMLPAWSDNWPESVQLKWLDMWFYSEQNNREEVKVYEPRN